MCGITGIISKNKNLITQNRVKSASGSLAHRGPNDEGIFINEENTIALGHRRLSIIDLSKNASQPMSYLGRYRIIHNGELYNYLEVREELKKKGYNFSTQSDTEVIVAAYNAYGAVCLQKFDGMFAFAIWDEKEHLLFAARDRFGEKPFFFSFDHEQFLFASEIKALWKMGLKKEVNLRMLYNFLSIGYTTNPFEPKETFFENVYKLPAASFLRYAANINELKIEKYWEAEINIDYNISEQQATEKFSFLFSQSIKNRLRSDVSIGTSLSGGLDSSAIVAYCSHISSAQYSHKCFTASFKDFEKDELRYAELVASTFHLEHYIIEFDEDNTVALMKEVMKHQELPIASASALAQYKVYEAAKKVGVTVLLDGQGADEILAGYHKYYKWRWQELYGQKQLKISGELKAAKAIGIKDDFGFIHKAFALFPEFAGGLLQSSKTKKSFHNSDFSKDFAFSNKFNLMYSLPSSFSLNGALYFNTFVHGLEELLMTADRNSMAHAVELRLPFLYHCLVEFLFTLPPHFKIHNGWTKWLLRKNVEPLLPKEIVWRRDKIGFEPPQKDWMQQATVAEAIQEGKKKLVERGILSKTVLPKKIQPHDAHAADNRDWKYWSASMLFNE